MPTIDGKPLRTVIHKLKPIKEVEGGHWRLKWKCIRHRGIEEGDGTWNVYVRKCYDYHYVGLMFDVALPQDGSQYGRRNNSFSARLGLWWCEVNFWVKWGFEASTRVHGDGVDGIKV